MSSISELRDIYTLENIKGHFKTITTHKMMVMKLCFRAHLFKQGLLHDLSKYTPSEFFPGVKYYQGYRSPNAKQREVEGYSAAWLHHKGRNKHHYEYWIDYHKGSTAMVGSRMPNRYVVEMFCDRVAASKVYKGDKYTDSAALEYYLAKFPVEGQYFHETTEKLIRQLLTMLAKYGEPYTFRYIRKFILMND